MKSRSITRLLTTAAALWIFAGAAFAQQNKGSTALLSTANGDISVQFLAEYPTPRGIALENCLPLSFLASWDGLDDADNIVIDLDIGEGNMLTGVGWDIGITTVGDSWLSEATIQFSDSTGSADPNAINLNVGDGNDAPGDQDFSSGGAIIDFSDNGLPDVTAGADGILRIQLFDSFDDNADAIDAHYREPSTSAMCTGISLACLDPARCEILIGDPLPPQTVAINSHWALFLLIFFLAGTGAFAVFRLT